MPRGQNVSKLKLFLASVAAVALFAVVAVLLAVSFGCVNYSAYAEDGQEETETGLKEYEFSSDSVVGVRSEAFAAVYFTQSVDESLKFKCVFEDESETVQSSPYFFDLDGAAKIFIVRDEDEEYAAFERQIEIIDVADKPVRLPDGQKSVYSGKAQSWTNVADEEIVITFETEDGFLAEEVKNVGVYFACIEYASETDESVKIKAVYEILPMELTVQPTPISRRYLDEKESTSLKKIKINKTLTQEDEAYITENTTIQIDDSVKSDSPVGQYPIYATYVGDSPNFVVTTENGIYTISEARLYGFTLPVLDVKYDGKAHRQEVKYDKEKWQDVTIEYNFEPPTAVGEYKLVAVVKKANYTDLTLEADIIIRGDYLESSSLTNYIQISGNDKGYSSAMLISLVKSQTDGWEEAVEAVLISNEKSQEKVIACYDVLFEYRGISTTQNSDPCDMKIKLNGLDTATGVRILRYDGKEVNELEYTFENGYFLLSDVEPFGLVFVKSYPVKSKSPLSLIPAVLVGIVVVIVVLAVLSVVFVTSRRERRSSRRRHGRWA